jgi:excisionase family DNA binding protein
MHTIAHLDDYLSIREAAEMLKVSPITIRRRIEAGELSAVQLGGRGSSIRIPRAALEAWLNRHPAGGDAA